VLAHILRNKLRPSIPGETYQTGRNDDKPDVLRLLREGIDIRDYTGDPKQEKKRKQRREYLTRIRAQLQAQGIQVRDFAVEAEAKRLKMAREELERIQHELQANDVEVRDFAGGASGRREGKQF
jgi:2C-methyl-D-erythritol 2,4-cyclodiphosphate synthase